MLSFILVDFKWVLQVPGAHSKVPYGWFWGQWEAEPLELDTCQPTGSFSMILKNSLYGNGLAINKRKRNHQFNCVFSFLRLGS